ncbi:putative C6 transcription factor [Aspergillus chevalieri]|uniref:Zn(2)-C6 fungal-type domain-containing protein n=1 Tax=Aspergillus chevalieri TaxID=182096 RepID=A0A7R7ZPB2_ASPCH|nr:uncharacterized protein ACHE_40721A [Aspergillus chevalieri]BCR88157.1 hypothetical protein ACHE_40721A [Aspergillus chevalieri]
MEMPVNSDIEHSNPLKRQRRSRVACEPCRERKRKCNGRQPCETCSDFQYTCYYDASSRKKRNKNFIMGGSAPIRPAAQMQQQQQQGSSTLDAATPSTHSAEGPPASMPASMAAATQSIESNSGAAFARELGLRIDPINAPEPQVFAWNIGFRQLPGSYSALPIVNIISQDEMVALANIYFGKVNPYYGFIDRDICFEHLNSRWLRSSTFEPYDVVLCGVAAMGYLFSQRKAVAAELHLIESARSALEQCSLFGIPSSTVISGWTLRLSYMRLTASPHAAWMTSCSLLHLIEASGLHLDPSSRPVLIKPPQDINDNIRRKLVGFVQYINTWTSFDLGRSRIILHGASYNVPASREGDYTAEMLNLLPLSESLDPHKPVDSNQLTTMLSNIMENNRTQQPSVLSQCNLILCIFRRLRALHSTVSVDLMNQILALITKALASARELADANCPWSHVANVPFQIVCTLLAVDSPESISLLGDAMQTLKHVTDVYDTDTLREAYRNAGLLVLLQQKRKDHDARHLSSVLNLHFAPSVESDNVPGQRRQSTMEDSEYLRDMVADMPSSETFDFDKFFIADNPWDFLEIYR